MFNCTFRALVSEVFLDFSLLLISLRMRELAAREHKSRMGNQRRTNLVFRRGYAKRETTISMGQNMQMCQSLRCKQIDMSTANDLKSIFPNNAGGTCQCNRVKTG